MSALEAKLMHYLFPAAIVIILIVLVALLVYLIWDMKRLNRIEREEAKMRAEWKRFIDHAITEADIEIDPNPNIPW